MGELTGRSARVGRLPLPINSSRFRPSAGVLGATYNPLVFLGVAVGIALGLLLSPGGGSLELISAFIAAAFAILCARLSTGVASRTYTRRAYRRDGLAWLAVFTGGAVIAFLNLNPSPVVSAGYLVLVALVLALVTATTVPPKPELYLSTGAEPGALHPITMLPDKIALNNHNWISDLNWTDVAPDRLRASGVLNENDCDPSCAEGAYIRSGVEVVATNPILCEVDVYPNYTDIYYTVRTEIYTALFVVGPSGELLPYTIGNTVHPPRCA